MRALWREHLVTLSVSNARLSISEVGLPSQRPRPRIQHPQRFRLRRRLQPNIQTPVSQAIRHLRIPLLAVQVRVVVDEIVPTRLLQLGRVEVHSWGLLLPHLAGIAAGVDQEDLVAHDGEVGGHGAAAGAGADDDVVIDIGGGGVGVGAFEGGEEGVVARERGGIPRGDPWE
jgi:hypothetical protein